MYLIQDDVRKFKGEFIFYYEQYREDLKKGQLKELSTYMKVGTEHVY